VRTVKSIIHKKAKLARAHTEIKIQKKPKGYTKEEKSFIIKYKQAGKTLGQMITDCANDPSLFTELSTFASLSFGLS